MSFLNWTARTCRLCPQPNQTHGQNQYTLKLNKHVWPTKSASLLIKSYHVMSILHWLFGAKPIKTFCQITLIVKIHCSAAAVAAKPDFDTKFHKLTTLQYLSLKVFSYKVFLLYIFSVLQRMVRCSYNTFGEQIHLLKRVQRSAIYISVKFSTYVLQESAVKEPQVLLPDFFQLQTYQDVTRWGSIKLWANIDVYSSNSLKGGCCVGCDENKDGKENGNLAVLFYKLTTKTMVPRC